VLKAIFPRSYLERTGERYGAISVAISRVSTRVQDDHAFSLASGGSYIGKRWGTYPAYLCPLHCGGAVSHSRLRTTILHSECGDCKRFCEHLTTKPRESRPRRPSKGLSGKTARTKKRNQGLPIGS
jgi:hypothetical protein